MAQAPSSASSMPAGSKAQDEWIFSVRLPAAAAAAAAAKKQTRTPKQQQQQNDIDNDNNNNDNNEEPNAMPRLVELRHCQPPRQRQQQQQQQQQRGATDADTDANTESSTAVPPPLSASQAMPMPMHEAERVSLLRASKTDATTTAATDTATTDTTAATDTTATTETTDSDTGWKWQSPYWSLETSDLLTVVYRAAWQTMPEYTTAQATCGGSACLRRCCPPASASSSATTTTSITGYDDDNVYSETFHTQDVIRVETLADPTMIVGVGPCRCVKLHLRPLACMMDSSDCYDMRVPAYWRPAWERHVARMAWNQQQQQQQHKDDDDGLDDNEGGPVLTFCLPMSQVDPPLLWKVHFPPSTTRPPIAIESLTVFEGCIITSGNSNNNSTANTDTHNHHDPTHIYLQGYQSWSFTGSIVKGQDQPKPAMPDVLSRAFNAGGQPPPDVCTVILPDNNEPTTTTRKPKVDYCYQSDFFTCITSDGKIPNRSSSRQERQFPYQQLDETGGPAVLLGWLSQHEQFGIVTADKDLRHVQMHASGQGMVLLPGSDSTSTTTMMETDWAYAQLVAPHSYDEEPMAQFLHCVAGYNQARPLQNGSLLTGWCSWYHYYENISADTLRENFAKLAAMRTKVPTNVAVIDDGYMTAWGDWDRLKPNKFPDEGLAVVARDIEEKGMRPGLWLAPFAADKHSKIVKEHPDWVIRNDLGAPANSSNCGKFFYGLDATNPEVRAHVYQAVRRAVHDWKFNVLKIDFLYAACLEGNGKYDLSMSRAQAMHLALQTIRDAAGPEVFLIGCGCPIASGVGYVDGMRVSADTGPTWYPALPFPYWDQGTLPCLRSMVRNSITRSPMGHRWWHNDPDCLLLGETTRLTDVEVASAASIVAMTCGMMLLSDDLTKVSLARMRIVMKIFPLTGVTAVVLDLHSTNDGLPSLLRLWCTDNYDEKDTYQNGMTLNNNEDEVDHNAEATFYARQASFQPDAELPAPNERKRSCIHVAKGLGTWTVVSLSNWTDKPALVHVPPPALLPPPETGWWGNDEPDDFLDGLKANNGDTPGEHGYHVFAFWCSKYTWIPDHRRAQEQDHGPDPTISKKLAAHETEIFHSKPVTPHTPQYIGSDLHFSCGQEVRSFAVSENTVHISLKTAYNRVGHVFVFVPTTNTNNIRATVNGAKARWIPVGNVPRVNENGSPRLLGRIIRIMVVVHANGTEFDGQIKLEF